MPHGPAAGELLIASAAMGPNYFEQTVIYLLDSDETGALGVVLNKLSDADLSDVLPQWEPLVSAPQVLFAGGPVSQNGAVCVARLADPSEEPLGWRRVFDDIGLLHLDTPVEIATGAYRDLRIFAGYAGWDPGQLESELLRGDWHRTSPLPGDIFGSPEGMWRRVLRRQRSELAFVSTWVEDPDVN